MIRKFFRWKKIARAVSSVEPFRIAIFISGHGSNMRSIIRFIQHHHEQGRFSNVVVQAVISDEAGAPGLKTAEALGVKSVYLHPGRYRTKLDGEGEDRYLQFLAGEKINLICLAGFMRMLKQKMVTRFSGRLLNVHPSLLPSYSGLKTHERVLRDGCRETGCTIHLVDAGMDTGRRLTQRRVRIHPEDDPVSLAKKVIQQEHLAYQEVLEKIFRGEIHLASFS